LELGNCKAYLAENIKVVRKLDVDDTMLLLLMVAHNHILHRPVRPVYKSGQTGLSRAAGNHLVLTCQYSLVASIDMFIDNAMFFTAQLFLS